MTKTLIVLPNARFVFNGSQRDARLYLNRLEIKDAELSDLESAPSMSEHLPAALKFVQAHGTTTGGFTDFCEEFMINRGLSHSDVRRLFDEAIMLYKATLQKETGPTDEEVREFYRENGESQPKTVRDVRRRWPMPLSEAMQLVKRVTTTTS